MAADLYHSTGEKSCAFTCADLPRWQKRGIFVMLRGESGEMTIEQASGTSTWGTCLLQAGHRPARHEPRNTLRLMREQGVGCVLVCEGERLSDLHRERRPHKLIGSRG